MITLINTWQQGDVSLVRHGGDLEKCLSEITAKGLIMPSKTDLYFPVSNMSYNILDCSCIWAIVLTQTSITDVDAARRQSE
jgi:hypothetical protein